jgi:hypothetical protein
MTQVLSLDAVSRKREFRDQLQRQTKGETDACELDPFLLSSSLTCPISRPD